MYGLRTESETNGLKATVDKTKLRRHVSVKEQDKETQTEKENDNDEETDSKFMCSLKNGDACFSCGA